MSIEKIRAGRQDFRLYLQAELSRRCQEDPRYSLRSFARVLDTDPSALSKILKGQRPVAGISMRRFGKALGLTPQEIEEFVVSHRGRKQSDAGLVSSVPSLPSAEYHQIELDTFKVIADWQHYAILELIRVDGFKPDLKWVARSLRISQIEAGFAVERMVRLGLLEITPSGRWIDRAEVSTNIVKPFFDGAQRRLQRQVLELGIRALEETPISFRDQTSMTFAADSERLPEAREMIKKFRRDLTRFLSRGDRRDRVYHLSVSLYPVSEDVK